MMRNFPKIFLRAWRAFEFSHGLLTAVSLIPDQVFRSDGCDGVGDHPFSFASQAELWPPARRCWTVGGAGSRRLAALICETVVLSQPSACWHSQGGVPGVSAATRHAVTRLSVVIAGDCGLLRCEGRYGFQFVND